MSSNPENLNSSDIIREIRDEQIDMRKDISLINTSINKLVEVQHDVIKANKDIKYIIDKQAQIDNDRINGCNYSKLTKQRVDELDKKISTTNKTLIGVASAAIAALIRSIL